jgi:hypothetical protein
MAVSEPRRRRSSCLHVPAMTCRQVDSCPWSDSPFRSAQSLGDHGVWGRKHPSSNVDDVIEQHDPCLPFLLRSSAGVCKCLGEVLQVAKREKHVTFY